MTKTKTTKRALIASVLSLLVCFSMLIGSTFAWFTDTATTGVNTIQSGNLKVGLEMSTDGGTTWTDAEGKTLDFVAKDGNKNILWEPGCTYELPLLRVVNKGNLALKFQIVVTGIEGDAKLNDVIEWRYSYGVGVGVAFDSWSAETGTTYALSAGGYIPLTISGHMDENAGNDYQDLTISGISITVIATQRTEEFDSDTNLYDEKAEYGSYQVDLGTEQDESGNYIPVVISDVDYSNNAAVVMGKNTGSNGGSDRLFDTNVTFNNVTVINNEVFGWEGTSLRFGTLVFGTATLNNCTITGTKVNVSDPDPDNTLVTDLGVFNYSKATINGGTYGTIDAWSHSTLAVYGAKVDAIYSSASPAYNNSLTIGKNGNVASIVGLVKFNDGTRYTPGDKLGGTVDNVKLSRFVLHVEAGAEITTLDLTGVNLKNTETVIRIDNTAVIGTIIVGDVTYTSVADFYSAYPNLAD